MHKTVVIVGGHLSPAIAVIEALSSENRLDIHFFGRKQTFKEHAAESFEYYTIKKRGIPFYDTHSPRLPHTISLHIFTFMYELLFGILRAYRQLKQLKPAVVVFFGGYLGGAVAVASWLAGIPIVIHEQTHRAGFANKLSAFVAASVLVAWNETVNTFHPLIKSKITITGNPVRKELLNIDKKPEPLTKDSIIYITGGSTGAHAINQLTAAILPELLASFRIIHQCGESHYHDYEYLLEKKGLLPFDLQERYTLVKFMDGKELNKVYTKAAIIIGRSGANTVVELAVTGSVAVLIPLPHGRNDEQLVNAETLKRAGSAIVVSQKGLTGSQLLTHVSHIASHFSSYYEHAQTYSHSKEITRHRQAASLAARIIIAACGGTV